MDLDTEIQRRLFTARMATVQAGKLALDYFERGVAVEMKGDMTPVTIADREAEEMLRTIFHREFPGDGYLGEEYGEEASTSGFRWIIDPIDGTKNFIRGIPFFAALIGLEFEGATVAGLAYIPAMNRLYYASKGHGAFRDDRRIQVSKVDTLDKSQCVYTSLELFTKTDRREPFLNLVSQCQRTRGFGDFWGFLMVAEGSIEIAVEPKMMPWDVAALKPIVEEAGGIFTDYNNVPTIYGEGAVAGNPKTHPLTMKVLRPDL